MCVPQNVRLFLWVQAIRYVALEVKESWVRNQSRKKKSYRYCSSERVLPWAAFTGSLTYLKSILKREHFVIVYVLPANDVYAFSQPFLRGLTYFAVSAQDPALARQPHSKMSCDCQLVAYVHCPQCKVICHCTALAPQTNVSKWHGSSTVITRTQEQLC